MNWTNSYREESVILKVIATARAIYKIIYHLHEMSMFFSNRSNHTNTINIHCIGHSIGAHVCGLLGKIINAELKVKLTRITGLDPAGPCFKNVAKYYRLDKTDADYVDVIHTSSVLGIYLPIGHSNYYVDIDLDLCKTTSQVSSRSIQVVLKKLFNLFPTCSAFEFDVMANRVV